MMTIVDEMTTPKTKSCIADVDDDDDVDDVDDVVHDIDFAVESDVDVGTGNAVTSTSP